MCKNSLLWGTQKLEVIGDDLRRTAKQHQAAGCGFKRWSLDILQAIRGDASLIPKGRFGDIETQPCVVRKV